MLKHSSLLKNSTQVCFNFLSTLGFVKPIVMNKGAFLIGDTQTCLCLSTMPSLLGETSPISQYSHTEVTPRTKVIEAGRASIWSKVLVTGGICNAERWVLVSSQWLWWQHASNGVEI